MRYITVELLLLLVGARVFVSYAQAKSFYIFEQAHCVSDREKLNLNEVKSNLPVTLR